MKLARNMLTFMFGWQRQENPAKVRRFLEQVSRLTGTAESWPGLRA